MDALILIGSFACFGIGIYLLRDLIAEMWQEWRR